MPKGHIRVTACFIHVDVKPDDRSTLLTLPKLRKLIFDYCKTEYKGVPGPEHPRFKRLAVIVEGDVMAEEVPVRAGFADFLPHDSGIRFRTQEQWLRIAFRNEEELFGLIEERELHAQPQYRIEGHSSEARGPDFLGKDVLTLFFGSRRKLQLAALFVIEWVGEFKELIMLTTVLIAGLGELDRFDPKKGICTHVKLADANLYPGYFNTLLAEDVKAKRPPKVLSTAQVMRLLRDGRELEEAERVLREEDEEESSFADRGDGI